MMRPVALSAILTLLAFGGRATAQELPPAAERTVDFRKDIQPLFAQRCYACHGEANQINGLRLDRKKDALAGGHSGAAILPGDSANSRLVHLLAGYRVKVVMPPAGPPLTPEQIGLVRAWIDQGAEWPDDAVTAAPAPKRKVSTTGPGSRAPTRAAPGQADRLGANPIDQFILAKLEKENLAPSPEADRATLLRRVSLDLTGLPPSPEQIERFLADSAPKAYERAVDRLLRSEHYGEKWAMHWLDQVRYADSDGYEKDDPRPHARRYCHWVIQALNEDLPFDEFSIDQIAGDLLPHPTEEQLTATGFHRNTLKNREGGVNYEQFRFEENVDRVNTISTVWMGLTLGCAQCHDHKYDPLSQSDYYRFFAFVNNLEDELVPAPLPGERGAWLQTHAEYRSRREEMLCEYNVPELQPAWETKVKYHGEHPGEDTAWDVNWDTLAKMTDGGDKYILIPAEERTEQQADVVTDYFLRFYTQVVSGKEYKQLGFGELRERLEKLEKSYPQMSMARAVSEHEPSREHHIHVRGGWDRLGVEVQPGVPQVLPQLPAGANRLDLARWLFADDNPLTARVTVNRVWQEYFGKGIVSTSDDFGLQGDKPSHPELLDWLAEDFVQSGWSLKHLHKRIVMSAAYRQSSKARPEAAERDPDNRWLSRQNRLRLPAEVIRDTALASAGLLDDEVGGKSVYPPIPDGVTSLSYAGGFAWPTNKGRERYRRGLYIHFQRTVPYPMLMTFDSSERSVTECQRERSNTPLQALNLLNDPVFMEAAQGLATRVLLETPSSELSDRLDYAYELCFARKPSQTEAERLEQYYRDQMRLLDASPKSVAGWFPVAPEEFDRTAAAAWTGVSRVLLNTDEFITRE
ncbi:MAG: PSD1 and planctomycete cytochrome C domain-containing protein [Bryobacterales bacterium]